MSDAALLDRAADALLRLAADRPWSQISLREIAAGAEASLADLFAAAESKQALLKHVSARLDRAALGETASEPPEIHDRLFEAVMARVEAMEAHREALTSIARDLGLAGGLLALGPHLPHTARAILEGAGLEATPPRVAAMSLTWARIARVWRDDEGALNRTMAEIDGQLKSLRSGLARIGAGF